MTRFEITKTDAPLQQRVLPALPPRLPTRMVDLETGVFHHVLVGLEELEKVPWAVWWLLLGAAEGVLSFPAGWIAALATATGQAWDWWLLDNLPKRGISFGPNKSQWLMLAILRLIPMVFIATVRLVSFWEGVTSLVVIGASVGLLQLVGIILVYRGYRIEPGSLKLSQLHLQVPKANLKGEVRVLHVADVHLERDGIRERQLLEVARSVRPDLILFTGDFLNLSYVYDSTAQQQANALWRSLGALAPVYAVTGSPPVDPHPIIERVLADAGVHWLRDEIAGENINGLKLRIVGVTCTHDPRLDGEMLKKVLSNGHCNDDHTEAVPDFSILLYHAPDLAPQAASHGTIDLHLAGHTHGGQVRLPGVGAIITASLYLKSLEMGLYQLGEMLLFVSRGVGLEGKGAPRVRLNCAPQVTLIVLRGGA